MDSQIIWKGEHFAVRSSAAEDDRFFLIRPKSGDVLDSFDDVNDACVVGKYCDERGRSYAATIRNAAKLYAAKLKMPVAPCPMNAIEATSPQAEKARNRTHGGAA